MVAEDRPTAVNSVLLTDHAAGEITRTLLARCPQSVLEALDLAGTLAALRPYVGRGNTRDLWETLATLGAVDLAFARAVEPHLDAVTILAQAGQTAGDTERYGVFAAEGPGVRLTASPIANGWRLSGIKPWCSLAGTLSHALITAWVNADERQLFRVDLGQPGVTVDANAWSARGLQEIPSGPVGFDDVVAVPVGGPGWYLRRPGFAWGGMSVAACWFGGAVGVGRRLLEAVRERAGDDPILLMHLGAVDARLASGRSVLADAAARLDAGNQESDELLANRVRTIVAEICESVLLHVGHALGPGPLATDPVHGKRVADLELYIRQHHAERDDSALGRRIRDTGATW